MTIVYIKHRLIYIIAIMSILTASDDTPKRLTLKRRRTTDYQESYSSDSFDFDGISVNRGLLLLAGYSINEGCSNAVAKESVQQGTSNTDSVKSKDILEIEEMTRKLKDAKIDMLDENMPIIKMVEILLKKADEEQNADKVKQLAEILSDFKDGCLRMHFLAKKHGLEFIQARLFFMLYDMSPYNHPNSVFLCMLFYYPGPHLTADAIRTRFKTGFLESLSTNQIVRTLTALLNKNLCLSLEERRELVETVFGQIDFSLDVEYSKNQTIKIITAILRSEVPEFFEEVFLTWKMWYTFTPEEQEGILKNCYFDLCENDRKKYKRETMVMLYLFLLNKDEPNSITCESFKENIIKNYGKSVACKERKTLVGIIIKPEKNSWKIGNIIKTFDSCLLDLPDVLKNADVSSFKDYARKMFYISSRTYEYYGARYKIHVCYALTKFTSENVGSTKSNNIMENVYFCVHKIKCGLNKWYCKKNVENTSRVDEGSLISVDEENDTIELKNVMGALRQIVQSKGYNSRIFFELYTLSKKCNTSERVYYSLLLLLTRENILKEVKDSSLWQDYKRNCKAGYLGFFQDIEDMFMININNIDKASRVTINTHRDIIAYIRKIDMLTSKLLKTKNAFHRERYLCSRLIFHPKFKVYKDEFSVYLSGLKLAHMVDEEKVRTQLSRDLIFNDYYYEVIRFYAAGFIKDFEDLKRLSISSRSGEAEVNINKKIDIYRRTEKRIMNDIIH